MNLDLPGTFVPARKSAGMNAERLCHKENLHSIVIECMNRANIRVTMLLQMTDNGFS
jgi:hypothetical protein